MLIPLVHGEPIRFGAEGERGVVQRTRAGSDRRGGRGGRGRAARPRRARDDPSLAFALSRLAPGPHEPTPIGVFRAVERPTTAAEMARQVTDAQDTRGLGDVAGLLRSGSSWTVD